MANRRGTSGADRFDATALREADRINAYFGLDGDDTLIGGALTDRLIGGEGSDLLVGGDGADVLGDFGTTGNDRLDGGTGDDLIEGRYGFDTLIGGAGHDTIRFGFGSMLVDGGQGDDIFISIGRGPATATITGGAGDDVLQAGVSADAFDGGQGEDLVDYSGAGRAAIVDFQAGVAGGAAEGDTFRFVEDIVGTAFSDVLTGNGVSNVLIGGAGNDTIGGGLGGDFLDGGDGIDLADLGAGGSSRVVANLATGVFIGGGADGDTILNFEGVAGGEFADTLTGDAGANTLIGRGGDDTLTGGGGADTLIGGLGADLYLVDDLSDLIVEEAGAGIDRVEARLDYSLASTPNVDNLTLIGAVRGTGNGLANVITGNDLDNVLDGGRGADTLVGGLGNDSYYVDSNLDRIVENRNSGLLDQVFASGTFNLGQSSFPAQIERVTLIGSADIDFISDSGFTGQVFGNEGDNRFTVRGNASFTGGAGDDAFFFTTFNQKPFVTDFTIGTDTIELDAARYVLRIGALNDDAFRLGRTALDRTDRVLYDQSRGELLIDRDGTGTRYSPQLIGAFEPGLALRADDFFGV